MAEAIANSERIRQLTEQRETTNFLTKGKPISEVIADLEAKIARRQAELTAQQAKITQYRTAKRTLEKLNKEKVDNDTATGEISARGVQFGSFDFPSATTEEEIDKAIKELEKKKTNIAKGEPKVQLEIEALIALRQTFGSNATEQRDQRCFRAKMGELPLTYVTGTGWEKYPKTVLRVAQLLWGNEILLNPTAANKERIEGIQVLLKSQKYLDVIVTSIDATGTHLNVPGNMSDGAYIDLDAVFAGSNILTIDFRTIDKKKIDEIREKMRVEATHVTHA